MLRFIPKVTDPAVLVDAGAADDAAVIRTAPGAERALVLTTDFFTPIVDDAYDFGRIAAANALSDVYAMGGEPRWCLTLVGWPRDKLPLDMLGEVLRGAADVAAHAGAVIVGGHSIDDPEPKFGLVVVGDVDPGRMTTNAAAKPGDELVLTKPIGSGIIATAIKREIAPEPVVRAAVAAMTTLNKDAALAGRAAGVVAATDVTGFGLLGHAYEMMDASGTTAEFALSRIPLLSQVRRLVAEGVAPGGSRANMRHLAERTAAGSGVDEEDLLILSDAQTSGGLLVALPADQAEAFAARCRERGATHAAVVGSVKPRGAKRLEVVRG